jgi:ATP/maltotriose-dependent transcriptional regulator MalT
MALARGGHMEQGEAMLHDVERSLSTDAPPWLQVDLVLDRAIIKDIQGDEDAAYAAYAEVHDRAREAGDPARISRALNGLAEIARARGDLGRAEQLYGDALEIERRLGHVRFMSITLVNLCMVALARGELDEADRRLDEVIESGADVSHPEVAVVYSFARALVSGRRGDMEQARSELHRFQAVNARVGLHEPDIAEALEELGLRFRVEGDPQFGDELTEQAALMWQQLGREDRAVGARADVVGAP